jgi:hypothetical protein
MVTMTQLRDCDPGLWTASGDEFALRSHTTLAGSKQVWELVIHPLGDWSGTAGQAAQTHLQSIAERLEVDSLELLSISYLTKGLGHAFQISRNLLLAALKAADSVGLTVTDDGRVLLPADPATRHDPEMQRQYAPLQRQIAALIDAALLGASNADSRAQDLLQRIASRTDQTTVAQAKDEDLGDASRTEVDLIAGVVPTDPAVVATWWAGLAPADQQFLLQAVPWELENLNGIPDSVRAQLHGTGGYDHTGVASWAIAHWNDNSDDLFSDNCTNFVSDSLEGAGVAHLSTDNIWIGNLDPDSGWDKSWQTGIPAIDEHDYSRTASWAQAQKSYDFWSQHGTEVPQSQAQPGDIVYFEQADPGYDIAPGTVHHAAVVTSVVDGDIRYTQHTTDQLDASLGGRSPVNEIDGGKQAIHIVRPGPDW